MGLTVATAEGIRLRCSDCNERFVVVTQVEEVVAVYGYDFARRYVPMDVVDVREWLSEVEPGCPECWGPLVVDDAQD